MLRNGLQTFQQVFKKLPYPPATPAPHDATTPAVISPTMNEYSLKYGGCAGWQNRCPENRGNV